MRSRYTPPVAFGRGLVLAAPRGHHAPWLPGSHRQDPYHRRTDIGSRVPPHGRVSGSKRPTTNPFPARPPRTRSPCPARSTTRARTCPRWTVCAPSRSAAVVAYHLGSDAVPGGLLGVGIFFTLSGFLITGILRSTVERTGGLDLAHFWLRRARRLLPAVVLVLVVVLAVTALSNPGELGVRAAETVAAMFYVSNWTTIGLGVSYFARFNGPGPLDHLWSLAVEEQFYVVLAAHRLGPHRAVPQALGPRRAGDPGPRGRSPSSRCGSSPRRASTTPAPTRAPTRAPAACSSARPSAMLWRPGKLSAKLPMRGRVVLDSAGVLALVAIALLLTQTDEYSMFLYRGGILILSLATALLIAVATHPASLVGKAIGVAAAAVDRRAVLRHLPLAPAGDRLPARVGPRGLAVATGAALRDHRRARRAELVPRRGPDPSARPARRPAPRPRAPRLGRPADPLREPRPRHAAARQRAGPGPRGHGRAHRAHRHGPLDQQLGRADHRRRCGRPRRLHAARARTRDAVGHRHDVGGSGAVGHDDAGRPGRPGLAQDLVHRRHPHRRLDLARV